MHLPRPCVKSSFLGLERPRNPKRPYTKRRTDEIRDIEEFFLPVLQPRMSTRYIGSRGEMLNAASTFALIDVSNNPSGTYCVQLAYFVLHQKVGGD